MKKIHLTLFTLIMIINYNIAQYATIKVTKINMKSYLFSDPNPIPDISRIYPYFRFDGYTNKSIQKDWKMVILENDYIKVFVCPDIGGKIWGAIEKSTGREFLYFNHVVKFRDLAMRGPWTSGGMEYNFGTIGHDPNGTTPVDYVIRNNEDGSVSCIVGAHDLPSRTKWNVEIIVYKDKAFIETKASWFNCTSLPCTYYHWMNAAAKASGNLEFLYPGNKKIGHGGEFGEWPIENDRDLSFYDNNNFGGYKSYHVINSYSDYFGGYWHDDDFGFGHYSRYDDKPGKKIWIWGLSEQGMIWEDLLTDDDGQYIEYQSGKLFTQAAYSSTYTPFKHREFYPHDADIIHEIWFPLKNTGGMVACSEYAVLNVIKNNKQVEVCLSALQNLNDELKIRIGEKIIIADIALQPLELFTTSFIINSEEEFIVELGNKLFYSSNEKDLIVDRPVEPNIGIDWNSAYGLYTRALELEKQRMFSEALTIYLKSLETEPAFVPALNRAALGYYRNMDYNPSLEYVRKSLSVDTYDPMANYLYGLINRQIGEMAQAKNGFSIASQSPEYRLAAYVELATIFLTENKLKVAEYYARKALIFNRYSTTALEVLAIISRKEKNKEKAEEVLTTLSDLNATNHFVNFENVKWKTCDIESFRKQITNELSFETYLELALIYRRYGCIEEAVEILSTAPEQPIILLWLSYMDEENQENYLRKALELSIEMVFPYRDETAMMLQYFIRKNNNWKLKYYLALIFWNKGLLSEAKDMFISCENDPDHYIFFLARAKLFNSDKEVEVESLKKAAELNKSDWRVNLAWINHYIQNKAYDHALKLSKTYQAKYPDKSVFGFRYARSLINLKEYNKCLQFLEKYIVIPNEGATEGRNIYHEACIRAAYDAIKKQNFKSAIMYAQKAKQWLANLGVGKPYDVDERLENFIIAYAYGKMGMITMADDYYSKVMENFNPDYLNENSKLLLQAMTLRKYGQEGKAIELLKSAVVNYPDNEYVKWVLAIFTNDANTDDITNEILNNPVEFLLYDIKYIDEEFKLVTDLLEIILQ